jgi:hypothetical protein
MTLREGQAQGPPRHGCRRLRSTLPRPECANLRSLQRPQCRIEEPGRLAQRESASFTPRRSLVRSQYRPPGQRDKFEQRRSPRRGRDRGPRVVPGQAAQRRPEEPVRAAGPHDQGVCLPASRRHSDRELPWDLLPAVAGQWVGSHHHEGIEAHEEDADRGARQHLLVHPG